MSDDDMERVGIVRLGDRIALRIFGEKNKYRSGSMSSGNSSGACTTDDLIARLKEKVSRNKMNKQKATHREGNKFASKAARRIEVGWLHYDASVGLFRQVRQKCGGGTRKLAVEGTCDLGSIFQCTKDLFFPNGTSNKGKIEDFDCELANFDCNAIDHNITVEEAYSTSKVKTLHLYLKTKRNVQNTCSSARTCGKESENDDDLPDLAPAHDGWAVDTGTPTISFRFRETGQICGQHLQQSGVFVESVSHTAATAADDVCTRRAYEEYIDLVDDDEDDTDQNLQDALMTSLGSGTSSGPSATGAVSAKELLQSFQTNYFQASSGCVSNIVISRRKLLHSVKRALAKSDFSFYNPIKVHFSGEDAEDEGGPKREFLTLLMKTIVSEMGLLEGPPKNMILTHNLELLRQGQYYFAGQLVAWSVANGGPGLGCLSKHMIGLMCGDSVDDLSAAAEHIPDDEIRSVILEILSAKSDAEMASAVSKFSAELMDNGIVNQHRLTLTDRETVGIDLITNYLKYRISTELSQFTTGLGELWTCFKANPSALKDIFMFNDIAMSCQRLRQLYTINWAEEGSNIRCQQEDAIYNFEAFLQDCESGTNNIGISQLLAFWTGAESEPPLGFQTTALMTSYRQSSSTKPLLVDFYDDAGRLPYASTCAMCLWLPVNVTEDIFQSLLLRSVTECFGFGKV